MVIDTLGLEEGVQGRNASEEGIPPQNWSSDISREDMIAVSWAVDMFAGLPGPELVARPWASRTRPCGAQWS